jgi:chromosome segregation ATPase
VSTLNEQSEQLRNEHTTKVVQMEEQFNSQLERLQSELAAEQASAAALQVRATDSETKLRELEVVLSDANSRFTEEKRAREQLEATLANLRTEMESQSDSAQIIRVTLTKEFTEKEASFVTRIEELSTELAAQKSAFEELVRKTEESVSATQANNAEQDAVIASLRAEVAALNEQLLAAEAKRVADIAAAQEEAQEASTRAAEAAKQADEVANQAAAEQALRETNAANEVRLNELTEQLSAEQAKLRSVEAQLQELASTNAQTQERYSMALAEMTSLNDELAQEKERSKRLEAEYASMLNSASVLARVVDAADAAEAVRTNIGDEDADEANTTERELLLRRVAELEAAYAAATAAEEQEQEQVFADEANEHLTSVNIESTEASESPEQDAAMEQLTARNAELEAVVASNAEERNKLVAQLLLLTSSASAGDKQPQQSQGGDDADASAIKNQSLHLLMSTKDTEIAQLKHSLQQQQQQYQQLQQQYAAVTRNGLDMAGVQTPSKNGTANAVHGAVNGVSTHSGEDGLLATPGGQPTNGTARKVSTSITIGGKAFTFAPEILPMEGSIANMYCGKLVAQLYLSSKTGIVMEKTAVVLRRQDSASTLSKTLISSNGLLEATTAMTTPPEVVLFECELTGTDNLVKRLRFRGSELRSVRRGKGKTMSISQTDKLCLHIIIDGKGELNLSLPSEQERDAALKFFKVGMMHNSSMNSSQLGSLPGSVR